MDILSIGNSFSVDATRYLSSIAHSYGKTINTINLYIGGCSLYTHYVNAIDDRRNYELDYNGSMTRFKVSIKEALTTREFDIVTLQQASPFSFRPESYEPYTAFLVDYVHKYCPKAKIFIHQTWGYKRDSKRLADMGFATHAEMSDAVAAAYDIMYENVGAYGLLPSGKAMKYLDESGFFGDATHRDDIHVSLGLGRFTLALTWFEYLTGISVHDCGFCDFDVDVSEEQIEAAKSCAHKASQYALKYKKQW